MRKTLLVIATAEVLAASGAYAATDYLDEDRDNCAIIPDTSSLLTIAKTAAIAVSPAIKTASARPS